MRMTESETLIETSPSLRPLVLLLGLVVVVGGGIAAVTAGSPELLGSATQAVQWIATVATALASIAIVGKLYVRSRTRYLVGDDRVEKRFSFLLKEHRRVLPTGRIRGYELNRARTEALLGYGTVVFLTGGTNQSLGFLRFEAVPNPDEVCEAVEDGVLSTADTTDAGSSTDARQVADATAD